MNNFQILILDDDDFVRNEMAEYLQSLNIITYTAGTPSEAYGIIGTTDIDLMLLDLVLPETNGFHVLEKVKHEHPDIEVVIISGHGDMESSIKAMRLGAIDFFRKPFNPGEIYQAIERSKNYIALTRKVKEFETHIELIYKCLNKALELQFVGKSPQIKAVLELMQKVAATDNTSVFISGESGTGKELVAKGIHLLSKRKNLPFCPVNCSAFPSALFESEFFGHTKGAFTGAVNDHKGFLEISNNGTLFLDEISEMPVDLQAKLLRVLEDRKFSRIGSTKLIDTDVRIIASTNQNIHKLLDDKHLRKDLFYRLNAFEIYIPPLRERREDIPELLRFYVNHYSLRLNKKCCSIDKNVETMLVNYAFPGNVRELRNIIERALILCDDNVLKLRHFPALKTGKKMYSAAQVDGMTLNLEVIEKNAITSALRQAKNNKAKAARMLNISRQALDRRLGRLNIQSV
ncbi:MAG: sigma-54 dependent transcriptional regulator [Bacteroidetes bacterium]|nr:sigma-54 dependent transcriptional regulator [Bacteroidota bacterium]